MTNTYSSGLSRLNFSDFDLKERLFNSYLRYDLDVLDVQNGLESTVSSMQLDEFETSR